MIARNSRQVPCHPFLYTLPPPPLLVPRDLLLSHSNGFVCLQEDGAADDEMEDDLGDQQGSRPKPSRTLVELETNSKVVGEALAARNRQLKAIRDSELKRVLSPEFVKRYVLYVRRYRYKVRLCGWWCRNNCCLQSARSGGGLWDLGEQGGGLWGGCC
jgi:hypothetical protein